MIEVTYKTNLKNVDWIEMKATLRADAFDNGRSPEQLQQSFQNSYAACIAYADRAGKISEFLSKVTIFVNS